MDRPGFASDEQLESHDPLRVGRVGHRPPPDRCGIGRVGLDAQGRRAVREFAAVLHHRRGAEKQPVGEALVGIDG